ncbi:hypothetical protein MMC25_004154 [Agyrium rufum]|nr:hypothetical protein [Agyrium rufum]
MIAPAIDNIATDLHIASSVTAEIGLSVFLLGLGFGPLLLSPLSEIYGRVPVLLIGNLFYLIWNTACGFAHTEGELFAFRLLTGLGASAPLAVGGGMIADLWSDEQRGRALAIYTLGPLCGPALGPIVGGFIAEYTTWRWVFWSASIADLVFQALANSFLRETYAPKILQIKARKLQKSANSAMKYHTEFDDPGKSLSMLLRLNLVRPVKMLSSQVIIQVLSIYMAILYGMMFLMLFTFPLLWTTVYHESLSIGGLNYISTGIGFTIGSQVCGPLNDKIYTSLKARNDGIGKPEFALPLLFPGSMLVPAGLFLYGWTGQYGSKIHWIVPNIGAAIFCAGFIVCFQCIQTYTMHAYGRYTASALSTMNVTKSLAGFGLPLLGPIMFAHLEFGWGCTVPGGVALVLGIVTPWGLWNYGERLRIRSTYASEE